MPSCYVVGCKTGNDNYLTRQQRWTKEVPKMKVLPRDPALRAKWISKIERRDKKITEENAHTVRVCLLHFAEDDIIVKRKRRSGYKTDIKDGAIPCIFPNQPSYNTKITKKRKPPLEREAVITTRKRTRKIAMKNEPSVPEQEMQESIILDKNRVVILNSAEAESAKPNYDIEIYNMLETNMKTDDSESESPENAPPETLHDETTEEDNASQEVSISDPIPIVFTLQDIKVGLKMLQLPGTDWGVHINGKGRSEFILISRINDRGCIDRSLTLNTLSKSDRVSVTFKVLNKDVQITRNDGPLIITSLDKLSQIIQKINNLKVCSGISCNSTNFSNTCSLLIGESEINCDACKYKKKNSEEIPASKTVSFNAGQMKQQVAGGLGQHFMAGW